LVIDAVRHNFVGTKARQVSRFIITPPVLVRGMKH